MIAPGAIVLVEILETCERLGVRAGEVYEATLYWLDPEKVTLWRRLPDGWDPECNYYRCDVLVRPRTWNYVTKFPKVYSTRRANRLKELRKRAQK